MKIAFCNEVLRPLVFEQQCRIGSALGYDALEVAPFTLRDDSGTMSEADALAHARIAADHGLAIFGLHWRLVAPAGLSFVNDDARLSEPAPATAFGHFAHHRDVHGRAGAGYASAAMPDLRTMRALQETGACA